jgi:hypothetical protein
MREERIEMSGREERIEGEKNEESRMKKKTNFKTVF